MNDKWCLEAKWRQELRQLFPTVALFVRWTIIWMMVAMAIIYFSERLGWI